MRSVFLKEKCVLDFKFWIQLQIWILHFLKKVKIIVTSVYLAFI
jgi:hypothetical protein